MRTIVRRNTIPSQEVTYTSFGCDHCDFTADEQEAVDKHYAAEHACKGRIDKPDFDAYRFETEQDAKAWLDHRGIEGWYRVRKVDWSGPGWYVTETWDQPCPRGCCTDQCIRLSSIEGYLAEEESRSERIMAHVRTVRAYLAEAGDGGG